MKEAPIAVSMKSIKQPDQSEINRISKFIWNITDDRMRDVYVLGKYRDVNLPFTVLRRLDSVLEAPKNAVLEREQFLDTQTVAEQDGALRMASGQTFYNVSDFTLATLKVIAAAPHHGRDERIGSENDPALQACQYLLPAALPGAGERRSGGIRH